MAQKAQLPPPIDKPQARAYLRKFTGWSTAHPPGLSDPTSLRVMHNCSIGADGSLKIRPGMRRVFNTPNAGDIVGEFEHFYTVDGRKAILYAIRENSKVRFRSAVYDPVTKLYVRDSSMWTRFPGFSDAETQLLETATYVRYVQIDNKILALPNNGEAFRIFWVGSTPRTKKIKPITRPGFNATDRLVVQQPIASWIAGPQTSVPAVEPNAADTLTSTDPAKNVYNFGYFYTFNNEIGETAASMTALVKCQRRWSAWRTNAINESKSSDQLVASIPQVTWDAAVAAGAVSWSLYWLTWSDQDSVPVEGVLLGTRAMQATDGTAKTRDEAGWIAHTPLLQGLDGSHALPNSKSRDNFTIPVAAANGLVAGDRLILVYDRGNEARISWTSNMQGDYLNFSSSRGGGFKTLTSGNLYLPVAVKLWQNPSSKDTVTIMCAGVDGSGTSFYMNANSSVSSQSQDQIIIGFEETSSTPGTTSPFGTEVLNNALYHPLDNNLMKSTASNYNINHLTIADPIQNMWAHVKLPDKRRMVSSQMDSSLYYLVRSPVGWRTAGPDGGNQIWVCDTALTNAWSCWDVVGTSIKRLELDGLLYMAIASGPSIFVFDPEYDHDDVWDPATSTWKEEGIPWEAVTNTQGANKAHDAWSHLAQANVTFGNFTGECVYGIRGYDRHGRLVEVEKHYVSPQLDRHDPLEQYDQQDYLHIRRDLKEWEFFWRSHDKPKNRSYGSVNFVQYRYLPISVNVGYAYGTVETFEYSGSPAHFSNGVPMPQADTNKP